MAAEFIQVDGLNWNDGIYVLIGELVFSAGMSNATQCQNLLNVMLVGESVGANRAVYQDIDRFSLPNSKNP